MFECGLGCMENLFSGGLCCPCTTIDVFSRTWKMQLSTDGKILMHYHHLWCIDIHTEHGMQTRSAGGINKHSCCGLQWLSVEDGRIGHDFIVFPQERDAPDTLYNILVAHKAMVANNNLETAPPIAAGSGGGATGSNQTCKAGQNNPNLPQADATLAMEGTVAYAQVVEVAASAPDLHTVHPIQGLY